MSDVTAPIDLDDASQVKNAKGKAARVEQRIGNAIRAQMETPDGRLAMWDLLSRCGVFRTSYTGEAPGTFFNEGSRNIGLQQLSLVMRECPDLYGVMVKEGADNA